MIYTYFVSYSCNKGNNSLTGHIQITRNQKIKTFDDIFSIKKLIEKDYDMQNVVISNFILLNRKIGRIGGKEWNIYY